MNSYLDVIPTPKKCEYETGPALAVRSVYCAGTITERLDHALTLFQKENPFVFSQRETADLVIVWGDAETIASQAGISLAEQLVFEEKNAAEQGYILKKEKNGPIVIAARREMGCVYGVMTLLQILGKPVAVVRIEDWPDYSYRGIKWLAWVECGIWSYDFGDGVEAMKARFARKLDQMMRYKLNAVTADGFGFDADRFPGYADVMRSICDHARLCGVKVVNGGYTMSYGLVGNPGTYQGKDFLNRKSYPDGEVYECIGTYRKRKDEPADITERLKRTPGRIRGTCLSNDALLELKMEEICDYVRRTHLGELYLHNMDAHEIHPELWMGRCEECRRRWPNDDLFAKDGAAGAFASYFDAIMKRLRTIKDGAYDAAKDLTVKMVSPGYLYAEWTKDEDFDNGVRFWAAVTQYMTETENFAVGFREQYFYHDKDVRRAVTVEELVKAETVALFFESGGDGSSVERMLTPSSALMYVMKGYTQLWIFNGNAFQEPQQVYNAEYLWNSEQSGFYNYSPRPTTQEDFVKVMHDMINGRIKPVEIYGEGGFLDLICEKLYGLKIGRRMAEIYKLSGENGEPPIPCASNKAIYTPYECLAFPMRWDNENITKDEIEAMKTRFCQCSVVTQKAEKIMEEVLRLLETEEPDAGKEEDLKWLHECFCMGAQLCELLYRYMQIYATLHQRFEMERFDAEDLNEPIMKLRAQIQDFRSYIAAQSVKPVDKFGGSMVRREEMGEFLDYSTELMLASIRTAKRIPDERRPLRTRDHW